MQYMIHQICDQLGRWCVEYVRKEDNLRLNITIDILTSRRLELLYMDLIGPTQTESLNGNKYIMVIKDVYLDYYIKRKF
jgi:hypothetical protein